MNPVEEADRAEFESRRQRTEAWVRAHQDFETEMDVDDVIDDVPILQSPRQEFTEISMKSRDFASAFEEVTPGMYRTSDQSWSCPHVKDDPFEDEDKENLAAGDAIISSTNVDRCCRACFLRLAFLQQQFNEAGMKTFQERSAEDNESDPSLDKFGILASDQTRAAVSLNEQSTNAPNSDGAAERVRKIGPNNLSSIVKKRKVTPAVTATETASGEPNAENPDRQ